MKRFALTVAAVPILVAVALTSWELSVFDTVVDARLPASEETTYVHEATQSAYTDALHAATTRSLGPRDVWIDEETFENDLARVARDAGISGASAAVCQAPWSGDSDPSRRLLTERVLRGLAALGWHPSAGIRSSLPDREAHARAAADEIVVIGLLQALVCESLRVESEASAFVLGWQLTSLMSQVDASWYGMATQFRIQLCQAAIRRACIDSDFRAKAARSSERLRSTPLMDMGARVTRSRLLTIAQLVLNPKSDDEPVLGEIADASLVLRRFNDELSRVITIFSDAESADAVVQQLKVSADNRTREAAALKDKVSWWSNPISTPHARIAARSSRAAIALTQVSLVGVEDQVVQFATAARWSAMTLSLVSNLDESCKASLGIGAVTADGRSRWLALGEVTASDDGLEVTVGGKTLQVPESPTQK